MKKNPYVEFQSIGWRKNFRWVWTLPLKLKIFLFVRSEVSFLTPPTCNPPKCYLPSVLFVERWNFQLHQRRFSAGCLLSPRRYVAVGSIWCVPFDVHRRNVLCISVSSKVSKHPGNDAVRQPPKHSQPSSGPPPLHYPRHWYHQHHSASS